jgi:hypothetical protein
MKILLIAALVVVTTTSSCNTQKEAQTNNCFKGRLEIAGICSNYTIKLIEGAVDTAKIAANWTDEVTGKAYTNVFALGSPCTFPATLKEGDEFYFTLDTSRQNCAVCMAYYPKPAKALSIKVLDKRCN